MSIRISHSTDTRQIELIYIPSGRRCRVFSLLPQLPYSGCMWLLILGWILFLGAHLTPGVFAQRERLVAGLGEGRFLGLYIATSVTGMVAIILGKYIVVYQVQEAKRVLKPSGNAGWLELSWKKHPSKEFLDAVSNEMARSLQSLSLPIRHRSSTEILAGY